jgi:serine/threonine protein kinase
MADRADIARTLRYQVLRDTFQGPIVTMQRARFGLFDVPVHLRTYPGLDRIELLQSDRADFLHRVRELAHLPQGPNLPTVLDRLEPSDGVPTLTLVLQLPPGDLLHNILVREGRLSPRRTLSVLRGVARALEACRRAGEPHRGPTPDRVWLGERGEVLLLGYGEVLYREIVLSNHNIHDTQLMWHLPPEVFQQNRDRHVGSTLRSAARMRTDRDHTLEDSEPAEVYALAALAYTCLQGSHPFFTDLTDGPGGVMATLQYPLVPPEGMEGDHPVLQALESGLARSPQDREPTPHVWLERFTEAVEAVTSADSGPITVATPTVAAHEPAQEPGLPSGLAALADLGPLTAPPSTTWPVLWPLAALVLAGALVTTFVLQLRTPHTLVVVSDPPGLQLEEVIGHAAQPLGATPIWLTDRNLLEPLVLRAVGPDGQTGDPVTLHPAVFDDWGRCRSVELRLDFDRAADDAP